MSEWVNLDVVDGIGPVAIKRRRPREDPSLLDHEAAVLTGLDHPGVVRLVERRPQPAAALVTHFVGTHSRATSPPADADAAIAVVAGIADTLVDLHRLGIRHGAVEPSHVLVGPGGRPVLCGFSQATTPGTSTDESPTPADDVAALGRLIAGLLAGHDGLEPIPQRRSMRRRQWAGYRPRALLSLADHCQADDPSARPSMAGLAATIGDLVERRPDQPANPTTLGGGRLRAASGRVREITSTWPRPRVGAPTARHGLTALLAATGLAAAGIVVWDQAFSTPGLSAAAPAGDAPSPGPTGRAAPDRPEVTEAIPRSPDGTGSTTTTVRPAPATTMTTIVTPAVPDPETGPPGCPPDLADPGADTDGDGCADGPAAVVDHIVTVGGEQFVLGRAGDRVIVGDWDCDGLVTAVVVRRDPTGLWHFPTWAPPGAAVTADLVTDSVDPGTVDLRRTDEACDQLVATDSRTGRSMTVAVTP